MHIIAKSLLSLLLILSLALQPVMGAISTSKGQEIVGYDYDELGQSRPITAYDDAKRKADQAYAKLIIFATFVPADTDALIAEGILTAVTGGLGNVIGGAGKGSIAAGKIDEAINSAIDVNRGVNTATIGGKTCVYNCVVDGTTRYVGITDDVTRRGAEHMRSKDIRIEQIDGLDGLSRSDARAVEQALIHTYGLGKDGGTLINKINSISAVKNPTKYEQSLQRGFELLDGVDYQWKF